MSNVVKNDVTVLETLSLEEYNQSKYYNCSSISYKHRTDIFNKASRTTVCFSGAMDTEVMYCENCNETHTNSIDLDVEIIQNLNSSKDSWDFSSRNPYAARIKNVVCKKCGSAYPIDDVRTMVHARYAHESDTRLVYDKIYDDNDELVKYSLKICSMVVERGFYSVDHVYKIIFNTRTGQTYLYNNPLNKKNPFNLIGKKASLENINFNAGIIDSIFNKALVDTENPKEYKLNRLKEVFNLVYNKISDNLGYKPKTLEDYAKDFGITDDKEIYKIKNIAFFNRFPNLNPFAMNSLDPYHSQIFVVPKKLRKIKNISQNPLEELATAYKVKEVDLFKEYFSKGDNKLYKLIYFSAFFDNREYIENLVNANGYSIVDNPYSVDEFGKKIYSSNNGEAIFLRHLKKVLDEDSLYLLFDRYIKDIEFRKPMNTIARDYCMCRKINRKIKLDLEYISSTIMECIKNKVGYSALKRVENYIYDTSFKAVNDFNQKRFSFKLNSIREYYNSLSPKLKYKYMKVPKNNALLLAVYNYAPLCNPYYLAEMLFSNSVVHYKENHERELFKLDLSATIKDGDKDALSQIFELYSIPTVKSLRKRVLDNPKFMSALIFFSKLFEDVNIINNLLDSIDMDSPLLMPIAEMDEVFNKPDDTYRSRLVELAGFTKLLIENQGEAIVGKKLCNAFKAHNYRDAIDSYSMCKSFLTLYPNRDIDLTGSIKDIHDRLVALTGGAYKPFTKADFKPYKYSEEEFKLETELNGYTFRLAPNGRELALLGNELKNCVRSYADRARKKDCLIVSVSHNNEYKICIELTPKSKCFGRLDNTDYLYSLEQAKLYANTSVHKDKEAFATVLDWMDLNSIYNNSSDTKAPIELNTQRGIIEYEEVDFMPVNNRDFDFHLEEAVPF